MCNWVCKFLYFKSKIVCKKAYFDTNCYRSIARHNNRGSIDALIKKMRAKEKARCIDVRLSYLVASEMLAHLADPPATPSYLECKHGLYAAIKHIGRDGTKIIPGPDSEMHQFIFGTLPQAERIRQQSLVDLILFLAHHSFDDSQVIPRVTQFNLTGTYLQTLKDSWIDSFTNDFIKKHEPSFIGGWQLFAQNPTRRTKLLNEINAAEASGEIYREFAAGVCLYIFNGFQVHGANIDEPLLQRVINRFKPIFYLQLYIIKNICQGGYNLQKRQNDVTDYLIMTSFDASNSVFVSNETRHLVPNLHSFGYSDNVMSLDEYLERLGLRERVGP